MTLLKDFIQQINPQSLMKRMLLGAAIGFGAISFFIFNVDNAPAEWGEFWRVRPLIITPLAGAFAILAFYLKDFIRPQSVAMTIVLYFISTFLFIVGLWLGIILGLDGTMWN